LFMYTEATKNIQSGIYIFGNDPAEMLEIGKDIHLEFSPTMQKQLHEKKSIEYQRSISKILVFKLLYSYKAFIETYNDLYAFVQEHAGNMDAVQDSISKCPKEDDALTVVCEGINKFKIYEDKL
jgi:hypothetical protein